MKRAGAALVRTITSLEDREGKNRKEKKMAPKTKGNKESKNYCKNCMTTEKIYISFFFFMGEVQLG